ncbi:glycosyltransferase [Leptothoe sp. ISB3NOV94-8A]
MPLISVIVPVFNSERTIAETLQSVLKQTFVDFEVIVVNDGSQDSTLDKIAAINDQRIKVFSYENSGVSFSRNRGVSHASGDFIAFLDADDLWTTDKLMSQVTALQQSPQAVVAYSWVDCIDEAGTFLRNGRHPKYTGNVYQKLLLGNFLESGSTPLVRKQVFQDAGGFNTALLTNEDWEMWVRLAKDYEFVLVPEVQVLYRISARSKSFNLTRHEQTRLRIIEQVFEQVPETLQYLKPKCIANFYRYLLFKVLDAPENSFDGDRKKSLLAIKFLWNCLMHDKSLFRQPKTLFSASMKILLLGAFPDQSPRILLEQLKSSYVRPNAN